MAVRGLASDRGQPPSIFVPEIMLLPLETLFCGGCRQPFEAPSGTKDVECSHCGRPMHVVSLEAAGEQNAGG